MREPNGLGHEFWLARFSQIVSFAASDSPVSWDRISRSHSRRLRQTLLRRWRVLFAVGRLGTPERRFSRRGELLCYDLMVISAATADEDYETHRMGPAPPYPGAEDILLRSTAGG